MAGEEARVVARSDRPSHADRCLKSIVTRPAMDDERRRSRRPSGRAARPGTPPVQGPPWRRSPGTRCLTCLTRAVSPGTAFHLSAWFWNSMRSPAWSWCTRMIRATVASSSRPGWARAGCSRPSCPVVTSIPSRMCWVNQPTLPMGYQFCSRSPLTPPSVEPAGLAQGGICTARPPGAAPNRDSSFPCHISPDYPPSPLPLSGLLGLAPNEAVRLDGIEFGRIVTRCPEWR